MIAAIYPGTFDPVTKSHLEIIKRASIISDKLIVGVASDTSKNTLFSLEDRVSMMEKGIFDYLNNKINNIIVMPFNGLLVNFAEQHDIKVIIRGIRALSDFEYEFKMAYMNKKLNDKIETIFLPATEKENFISSSFVKEVARLNGDVSSLVQEHVQYALQQKYFC